MQMGIPSPYQEDLKMVEKMELHPPETHDLHSQVVKDRLTCQVCRVQVTCFWSRRVLLPHCPQSDLSQSYCQNAVQVAVLTNPVIDGQLGVAPADPLSLNGIKVLKTKIFSKVCLFVCFIKTEWSSLILKLLLNKQLLCKSFHKS